ncbi:hypothetical protein [Legionella sp. WA2022007384]
MESKSEKTVVIFSSTTNATNACTRLAAEGAPFKADKAVWLLRESSVPGLLTISHYSHGYKDYVHQRLGFVGGEWKFGPKEYHLAQEFSKRAEAAFSKALPENSHDSLVKLLTDCGYDARNQVIPKPNESSKNAMLIGYTEDAFTEASSTKNRYSTDF